MADDPASVPDLRASDADRERIADLLRHAAGEGRLELDELDERLTAAYTARTHAQLRPLVADVVPAGGADHDAVAAPRRGMPVRPHGGKGTGWVVAVMSGAERAGHWRLSDRLRVVSIMGGADLDLNDAELSARETTITVWSVMGGAEIRVPEGVDVHVASIPIMGGNDVKLGSERPGRGGPVLRLRLISIMGGSTVRRGPKLGRRERREAKRLAREERGRLH